MPVVVSEIGIRTRCLGVGQDSPTLKLVAVPVSMYLRVPVLMSMRSCCKHRAIVDGGVKLAGISDAPMFKRRQRQAAPLGKVGRVNQLGNRHGAVTAGG